MVETKMIQEFKDQLVEKYRPLKVVLFGSYAYGTPTKESDVDIFVILPFTGKSALKSAEILNKINPHFAIDLLVRTPREVQKRLELGDFFIHEIIEKGKVLYEAPDD